MITNFTISIINDPSLLTYYRSNTARNFVTNIPDSISIEINREQLQPLLNFLARQKSFTRQDKENYQRIAAKATGLIQLIKKEYHLK